MYTYICKTESLFCIVEINITMSTKIKRKEKEARKKEEDDDTSWKSEMVWVSKITWLK